MLLLPYIKYYLFLYMYVWACVTSSTPGTYERSCGQYSTTNCWCDVSAFDLRRSMRRLSKIDDRCVDFRRSMCRPSKIDVTMSRPSEIDVSTFGDGCVAFETDDRCVDLRRSVSDDVLTFEDR